MPLDRSLIRKGMMIYSDEPLPGYTPPRRKAAHDDNLSLDTDRLRELANEREMLRQRMIALRQKIDALGKAK